MCEKCYFILVTMLIGRYLITTERIYENTELSKLPYSFLTPNQALAHFEYLIPRVQYLI